MYIYKKIWGNSVSVPGDVLVPGVFSFFDGTRVALFPGRLFLGRAGIPIKISRGLERLSGRVDYLHLQVS